MSESAACRLRPRTGMARSRSQFTDHDGDVNVASSKLHSARRSSPMSFAKSVPVFVVAWPAAFRSKIWKTEYLGPVDGEL